MVRPSPAPLARDRRSRKGRGERVASSRESQLKRPQSNRLPIAILFAVLWAAGMVLRAPSVDLQSVATAVIAGAIVGGLMYWLFDKFRPPS